MMAHSYRWLYWTDYGTVAKIERASMDGSSRTTLHNTGLTTPIGLTLDYATQTLFWIDQTLDRLERSSADGSNRVLMTTLNIQAPYGITYFGGKLYWTDYSRDQILSTFVSSPASVSTVVSTSGDPYRIQFISEERQPYG